MPDDSTRPYDAPQTAHDVRSRLLTVDTRQSVLQSAVDILEDLRVGGGLRARQLAEAGHRGIDPLVPRGLTLGAVHVIPSHDRRRDRGGRSTPAQEERYRPLVTTVSWTMTGGTDLTMASQEEARAALERIATRLTDVDPDELAKHVVERTISCRVPDLDLVFVTRIHAGGLDEFQLAESVNGAQVRLTVNSDDLVALADDELGVAKAWASGRLKIEASLGDLLRLRKIL
jgi:SCP-2 sterol transfer family